MFICQAFNYFFDGVYVNRFLTKVKTGCRLIFQTAAGFDLLFSYFSMLFSRPPALMMF